MFQQQFNKLSVFLIIFLSLIILPLTAQSPLSFYRGTFSPMVAEAGGASSHAINPAGIYRDDLAQGDLGVGLLLDNLSFLGNVKAWDIIFGNRSLKDLGTHSFFSGSYFTLLQATVDYANGNFKAGKKHIDALGMMGDDLYKELTAGVSGWEQYPDIAALFKKREEANGDEDLKQLVRNTEDGLQKNIENGNLESKLASKVLDESLLSFKRIVDELINTRLYYDMLHITGAAPFLGEHAWGLDFSLRSKVVSTPTAQPTATFKTNFELNNNRTLVTSNFVPLIFQIYQETNLRSSFAFSFGESKEWRVGASLGFAWFLGVNQRDIVDYLNRYTTNTSEISAPSSNKIVQDALQTVNHINPYLDLGIIYNFGGLLPELSFLSVGATLRNVAGFIYQLNGPYPVEYSIDGDLGIFLNQSFGFVRLFGGAELLAIRGMFDPSPYSEIATPIGHFRTLLGVGLFENRLRLAAQIYQRHFSPSFDVWLGAFRFGVGGDFGLSSQTAGLKFYLNFRSSSKRATLGEYGLRRNIKFEDLNNNSLENAPVSEDADNPTNTAAKKF